jgi:c-di-GMP-binding flagellar brake protein YcgR
MSLASRQYNEKRNFLRMQIDSPVAISMQTESGEITGICRDLSGGGMQVEADRVLPMGAMLNIAIMPPHSDTPMLNAKAEVTRVDSGPDDTCTLGLEIREMLPT